MVLLRDVSVNQVAGTQPKAPFEAGLTVNQLVNQSMFQDEADATDSETCNVAFNG